MQEMEICNMNDEIKEVLERLKGLDNDYHYFLKKDISFNDNMYCSHILLDYITKLQQEKDMYKEQLRITHNDLQHYISRCEKAIEYINNNLGKEDNGCGVWWYGFEDYLEAKEDLLNILQNGSEEK